MPKKQPQDSSLVRNVRRHPRKKPGRTFNKAKSTRLFERAANHLESLILKGHWKPGEKLPSESELQDTFEVSRASVREALRTLESQGLIEVRTGAGAFVTSVPFSFTVKTHALSWLLSRRDLLLQLLELREPLEGFAASLAAHAATPEVVSDLDEIVQQEKQVLDLADGLDRQVQLDVRFHVRIANASGNQMAEDLISTIVSGLASSNKALRHLTGNSGTSLEEHRRIVQAIAERDAPAAGAAMRSHLSRVEREVKNFREEK